MRSDKFHYQSDINHSEQRSDTDNIPLPAPEKEITPSNGEQYEGRIHPYLYFGERTLRYLTDGNGNALTRHGYRTTPHLEGNADAHDGTSRELSKYLRRPSRAFQTGCQCHVKIYKPSEYESDDKLEELHEVEIAAQYEYLAKYQDKVHRNRVSANCPLRNTTYQSRQRKNERQ